MSDGFIAIYRWRVAAEHEPAFRKRWRALTRKGQEHGSFGSLLGRNADGLLVAVALWPSQAARDQAFAAIQINGEWPPSERLDEEHLQIVDDLWATSPFS